MASPCLQISWGPIGTELGQTLPVQFGGVPWLTSLNYRQQTIKGVFVQACPLLTSMTFPSLLTVEGFGNTDFYSEHAIQIADNTALATISFPVLTLIKGGAVFDDCDGVTSLSFPLLTTLNLSPTVSSDTYLWIRNNTLLQEILFPSLTTITINPAFLFPGYFEIKGNPALTTISLPLAVIPNKMDFDASNNALSQSTVDHILARLVANGGYVSGTVLLNGGTNAAPSVAGLADKATLIGRGVTVVTN